MSQSVKITKQVVEVVELTQRQCLKITIQTLLDSFDLSQNDELDGAWVVYPVSTPHGEIMQEKRKATSTDKMVFNLIHQLRENQLSDDK